MLNTPSFMPYSMNRTLPCETVYGRVCLRDCGSVLLKSRRCAQTAARSSVPPRISTWITLLVDAHDAHLTHLIFVICLCISLRTAMRQTRKRFTLDDAVRRLLAPFFPRDVQGLIIAKLDPLSKMQIRRTYCSVAPVNAELLLAHELSCGNVSNLQDFTQKITAHARGAAMAHILRSLCACDTSDKTLIKRCYSRCVKLGNWEFALAIYKTDPGALGNIRDVGYRNLPLFESTPALRGDLRAHIERDARDGALREWEGLGLVLDMLYPPPTPWPEYLTEQHVTHNLYVWSQGIDRGLLSAVPTADHYRQFSRFYARKCGVLQNRTSLGAIPGCSCQMYVSDRGHCCTQAYAITSHSTVAIYGHPCTTMRRGTSNAESKRKIHSITVDGR